VGEGVEVKVAVGGIVDVRDGDGGKGVAVGLWVGAGWLPQDAHKINSPIIAVLRVRDAFPGVPPARSWADRCGEIVGGSDTGNGFRSIGDRKAD
jgi:hypothetical protein